MRQLHWEWGIGMGQWGYWEWGDRARDLDPSQSCHNILYNAYYQGRGFLNSLHCFIFTNCSLNLNIATKNWVTVGAPKGKEYPAVSSISVVSQKISEHRPTIEIHSRRSLRKFKTVDLKIEKNKGFLWHYTTVKWSLISIKYKNCERLVSSDLYERKPTYAAVRSLCKWVSIRLDVESN